MILRKHSVFKFIFGILLMTYSSFSSGQSVLGEVNKVDDFSLKDYNGKEFSLSDFKDSKAIVVIFVATECPVSNAYNSRMESIYNDYKNKNVTLVGINSNKAEDIGRIKEHAKSKGLTFPILKDEKKYGNFR